MDISMDGCLYGLMDGCTCRELKWRIAERMNECISIHVCTAERADYCSVFTGVIVTARRFDRERQREYSITVTATDWAEEPLIGICQLTIQILDQNDNSPKFENLRYECKCCWCAD